MASRRRSLWAQVGALVGGNIVASALQMIGGFLTARLTQPSVLGLFNGICLVQGYALFLLLGINNGLNRELPYYVGKGDHTRVRELAAAAQAWALTLGAFVSAALLGVAVWKLAEHQWALAAGWATNAVTVFFLFYGTCYLHVTYRTRGDFGRLALIAVVQSGVALALVALVWWLAFYGLCLRAVLAGVVQLALLWYWRPIKVFPAWNVKHLLHLLKIGAPIFAVGQIYAWWITLDSTLVLYRFGARGLGLYSLAIMAGTTFQLLPDALGGVLYPQMAEHYGRSGDVRALVKSAVRPMALTLLVMVPLLVPAWFLVPPLIRWLLPNYVDAVPAVQWSLFVPVAMCLAPVNNVFNVVKRQEIYMTAIVGGMGTYYLVLRALLSYSVDMVAFPKAMLVGRIVFLVSCYGALAFIVRQDKKGVPP